MTKLRIITNHTLDGEFYLITNEQGIVYASGFGTVEQLRKRLPAALQNTELEPVSSHPYQKFIQAYYQGDPTALNKIPHTQEGSDFQKKVWSAISNIGYGRTRSYKELAETVGSPAAIRAVGTICGLNRLILLVPCHRVLKSDGSLGGYLYGPKIKESLLRHEGAFS